MKRKIVYLLLIMILLTGALSVNAASASQDNIQNNTCDQAALDQSEATFRSRLSENGQVPVDDPIVKQAALEYIRLSKNCYDAMIAERDAQALQNDGPVLIDEGPVERYAGRALEYNLPTPIVKWGVSSIPGTPGGTVTYSFMGGGLNLSTEGVPSYGSSTAFTSLNGFQPCFYTEVQTAFAAWSAVADIQFVEVADSNTAFDAVGATGDIRIGAHTFDGPSGTLAHAYLPYNIYTGDGDVHLDKDETWSCTPSGSSFDIGLVVLHELGHSIGLYHELTSTIAVMDPAYNDSLTFLQSDDIAGAQAIYGAPPLAIVSNDDFTGATLINSISFSDSLDTTGANATQDVTDPDNVGPCDGTYLNKGTNTVWYTYTPSVNESIAVDTLGSYLTDPGTTDNYDTYLAVWTGTEGNLSLVACDDDAYNLTSQLSFIGIAGVTYYFEVAQYNGTEAVPPDNTQPSTGAGGHLEFHVNISNMDVLVGTSKLSSYYLYPNNVLIDNYLSILDGPVKVTNTVGGDIFTSQRVTSGDSYNELMGYPVNQLTTEYWFPYYDHGYPSVAGSNMRTWVLVGNASDTLTADVEIYIGNVLKYTGSIAPGSRVTPRWLGFQGGPVKVISTNAVPIFASQRVFTSTNNAFNENLGYPANQFTTEYWFPWYDDLNLTNYILVGNTSTSQSANIQIYIAGALKDSYTIPASSTISLQYTDEIGGPVRVVSTNGVDIVTSQKSISGPNNSYNEVIGYPFNQFTTEYWFPWYDHGYPSVFGSNMRTWVLVGNPSTSSTATVNIYIDGNLMAGSPFSIPPGGNVTPRWIGAQAGPVHVVSNIPVFTSERVFTVPNSVFNEAMGIPNSKITSEYWYPWYDSVNMNNEILVSKP